MFMTSNKKSISAIGSVFFGDQKEIFPVSLNILLFGPSNVPKRIQFDINVLVSSRRLVQKTFNNKIIFTDACTAEQPCTV